MFLSHDNSIVVLVSQCTNLWPVELKFCASVTFEQRIFCGVDAKLCKDRDKVLGSD
jgi:hypothetical protein